MDEEDDDKRPFARDDFRPWLLQELKRESGLDTDELGLFEVYEREHARTIEEMLRVEREFVEEQVNAGVEAPNDSGFVAVEYYIKRFRYSDVIYLASLLETFLERASAKLTHTLHLTSIVT